MKLTPNFELSEFEDRSGATMPASVKANILLLAKELQVLRNHLGKPVEITSGYRSPARNAATPGAAQNSTHISGKGADFKVAGMTMRQLYNVIEKLIREGKMKEGGLGYYANHIHYDIRGKKARW